MTAPKIINAVLFNAGWFACILGAAQSRPALGPAVVVVLAAVHLWILRFDLRAAALLALAFPIGLVADGALVATGILSFPEPARLALAPVPRIGPEWWMPFMWINFATSLHLSLAFLRRRYVLGALVGTLGGPSAYYAGMKLGAVTLEGTLTAALAAVALQWALAMPLLQWLAERLWPAATPRWRKEASP